MALNLDSSPGITDNEQQEVDRSGTSHESELSGGRNGRGQMEGAVNCPLSRFDFSQTVAFFKGDDARQRAASDSRNAAISSPLRTSRTSRTITGWFQVLPSIALNRATSVN